MERKTKTYRTRSFAALKLRLDRCKSNSPGGEVILVGGMLVEFVDVELELCGSEVHQVLWIAKPLDTRPDDAA